MCPTPPADEPSPGSYAPYRADALLVEHDGPVTVVTINRPERRNAVDSVCADQLRQAFLAFDSDDDRSVAVLTGADGTFCAGADLKAVAEGDRRPIPDHGPGPMGPTRLTLSKPVIAAVEGYAVAGGIELALWCDLRVAAEDAVFGVFCRRFGVPLCDLGTVRLPRIIGHGRAMDLILTGRAVSAPEALTLGLANRVVDPGQALTAAVALAHQLAALPQVCLRSDRMSALEQWGLTEEDAAVNEAAPRTRCHQQRGDARGSTAVRGRCRPSWRFTRLTTPRTGPAHRSAPPSPPSTSTARSPMGAACSPSWSACAASGPWRGRCCGSPPNSCEPPSPAVLRPTRSRRSCSCGCSVGCPSRSSTAARPSSPTGTSSVTCATTRGRRLEWHRRQGHHTVIVSASPECYVSPAGEELGVDGVVATRLAVGGGGLLTGGYEGKNCRGAEKYARLVGHLRSLGLLSNNGGEQPVLWAYGNSRGDLRLLNAADHGVDAGRLGPLGALRRFPRLSEVVGVSPG